MGDYSRRMATRIRSEREKLALSELELAAKVGTTDRTVRRWEQGKTEPQPRHLRALAETFGIATTEIRPNLEAEENVVRAQLDRIEAKLDVLLSALQQVPRVSDETAEDAALTEALAELGREPGDVGQADTAGGRNPSRHRAP